METKSRYEVIADLEKQKSDLIREKNGFKDLIKAKEVEIKNFRRALEDREDELKTLNERLEDRKGTIDELIKGIEASLNRFQNLMLEKIKN